ncbi:hypothetical protein [Methylocystis echinoides]|uniref:hypothetical protein n=1 Tax=Methylocystis echinoides TaxID=29468 RepID=UPI0034427707
MVKRTVKKKIDFGKPSPSAEKALRLLELPIQLAEGEKVETYEWIERTLIEEEFRRAGIIAEQYGLDFMNSEHAPMIALMIARDFVPGFNLSRRRGAPRKTIELLKIAKEVIAVMKQPGRTLTVSSACEIVASRQRKSGKESKSREEIEQMFYRFLKARDYTMEVIADAKDAMVADKARWHELSRQNAPQETLLGQACKREAQTTDKGDN